MSGAWRPSACDPRRRGDGCPAAFVGGADNRIEAVGVGSPQPTVAGARPGGRQMGTARFGRTVEEPGGMSTELVRILLGPSP
jgi:hypothetical protein